MRVAGGELWQMDVWGPASHDLDQGSCFFFFFGLISILMRKVRIRPRVGAPPPDCGAPHPPWVVGLSQVIGGTRSRRGVGAGAGLCAQEADAGQRAGGSGEREGTAAGPDGAAERGGGP